MWIQNLLLTARYEVKLGVRGTGKRRAKGRAWVRRGRGGGGEG